MHGPSGCGCAERRAAKCPWATFANLVWNLVGSPLIDGCGVSFRVPVLMTAGRPVLAFPQGWLERLRWRWAALGSFSALVAERRHRGVIS